MVQPHGPGGLDERHNLGVARKDEHPIQANGVQAARAGEVEVQIDLALVDHHDHEVVAGGDVALRELQAELRVDALGAVEVGDEGAQLVLGALEAALLGHLCVCVRERERGCVGRGQMGQFAIVMCACAGVRVRVTADLSKKSTGPQVQFVVHVAHEARLLLVPRVGRRHHVDVVFVYRVVEPGDGVGGRGVSHTRDCEAGVGLLAGPLVVEGGADGVLVRLGEGREEGMRGSEGLLHGAFGDVDGRVPAGDLV